MTANIPHKPGRHPNKYYDPALVLQSQIEAVKEVYDDCEEIKATALELGLAELKVRKLLITDNVISYEQTDTIKDLQREGIRNMALRSLMIRHGC